MVKNCELFAHEEDYTDFAWDKAVENLRSAIRFDTTGYVDTSRICYEHFDAFHQFLRDAFPHVMAAGTWEDVGHSILITLPGTDPALRPALLMAHQDVVPVVKGTEADWLHGPFSGDLAEGYIWGRGAMDIKQMLIGILSAAEYLLSKGKAFRRTAYLAFGEDEETRSTGVMAISDLLKSRGVELEFVLDEGAGDVMDAADYGAPGALVCPIGVYEKGYADLKLTAQSRGGHSSNPFRGTSLGVLAQAIAAIVTHPMEAHLSQAIRRSLELLAPKITQSPMKEWVRDIDRHERDILGWFLSHESLYHQAVTTAAPTMISGGSQAGNVMPQNMEAVINFRLSPPDTPESLLTHCRAAVGQDVTLSYVQQIGPSVPSDVDGYGFRCLKAVLEHYFRELNFIPMQNRGATDARHYEQICRCVLRFGPFLEEEDISAEGIHGTNERISVRAYCQGIRVLTRLMETACI